MTPHASNEGTPRTDFQSRSVNVCSLGERVVPVDFARTLERENQSLARRVGELESKLRQALAVVDSQAENAFELRDLTQPTSNHLIAARARHEGRAHGLKDAASTIRATLNQGDKA